MMFTIIMRQTIGHYDSVSVSITGGPAWVRCQHFSGLTDVIYMEMLTSLHIGSNKKLRYSA